MKGGTSFTSSLFYFTTEDEWQGGFSETAAARSESAPYLSVPLW
jgi:hypothetical protein